MLSQPSGNVIEMLIKPFQNIVEFIIKETHITKLRYERIGMLRVLGTSL